MLKNIIISVLVILYSSSLYLAQDLEIIDDWYYISGKKFFVKGIGYETHTRPGQVPWIYEFDADLITYDLDRIKNAGYNTIRTWGALSDEELQLVEFSGLKILFGIWIDPHGDFGNEEFKNSALNHVKNVLNYSNKYNSIIGYIIMNEPQVNHIYDAGAQELFDLWQSIINYIHEKHPGIPVSFSNTMIGDYIGMDIFDFAAYNAYIYNPVTISKSNGYAGFLSYLKTKRSSRMPFIISEFGLSVSPGSSGTEYGYGSNTLEQQKTGDLLMYRGLIDAGAQGGCIFQYHDGWWKGGNEFVHDPVAEEWFGLIEFSGQSDKIGLPRPVWSAFDEYNKAIITNPKNECIYDNIIPLEFFINEDVSSYSISLNDSILVSESLNDTYYTSELNLNIDDEIKDIELEFYFLNSTSDILKTETISILHSKNELGLPQIDFEVIPKNLVPGARNYLDMHVTMDSVFSIEENKIDYVLHPHIGFDPGITKSKVMIFTSNKWSYIDYFDIPQDTKVATFAAGFTINYGKFNKRISNQKILLYGDWANPIAAPDLITSIGSSDVNSKRSTPVLKLFQNYPNPFNPTTKIQYSMPAYGNVQVKVYDVLGKEIATLVNDNKQAGTYEVEFDASNLSSGIYFYKIESGINFYIKKMILLR
ncbi:MAG: T9SS type A sorting domain-containing protein [Bacteroidota bacterium]